MSDEPTECLRVGDIVVPLNQVPGVLRLNYEACQRDVATKSGVARNIARAALNDVAREILADAAPRLALKASPRAYGARGFFESIAARRA